MKLLRGFRSGVEELKLYRRRLLRFPTSGPRLEAFSPRCRATAGDPQAHAPPQNLLDALSKYPCITVAKFPGSGRGLVAASNIKYGDTVLMELPLLCYQSSALADQVCYGCLMVLPTRVHLTSPLSGRHFCSEACMAGCEARFHALESLALRSALPPSPSAPLPPQPPPPLPSSTQQDTAPHTSSPLSAFEAMCVMNGERFPLMAARLAFTRLTRALTETAGSSPSQPTSPPGLPAVVCGDPVSDLGFLCFANIPQQPWVQLYQQLSQAMEAAVQAAEQQLLQPEAAEPAGPQQARKAAALRDELQRLSLDWFVSVLARLHINVFRVGCLLPQSMDRANGGQWLGPQFTTSGSAAYLVASLFNHSCEPNIEIVFRRNDSTAAFVAARDIDQGEQLFVSYIDEGLPLKARQEHLLFSYGFKCRCQRCIEDEEDAAG